MTEGLSPCELRAVINRFLSRVSMNAETGCWIWTGSLFHTGYGKFSLHNKTLRAHRVSYTLFKGDIPDGVLVLHTCDVRACVSPAHLFLGSYQDNAIDAVKKGRMTPLPKPKLSARDVINARAQHALWGRSVASLAQEFGVAYNTMKCAITGRTWNTIEYWPERRDRG